MATPGGLPIVCWTAACSRSAAVWSSESGLERCARSRACHNGERSIMKVRAPSVQIASATGVLVAVLLLGEGRPLVGQQSAKEAALTPQEQQGQMYFFQKCSICHLPPLVGSTQAVRLPFAPLLYAYID